MNHAVKHDFVLHALHAGHSVYVYWLDFDKVRRVTVAPYDNYTITSFGLVQLVDSANDDKWIRWHNVFHIAGALSHCVDWSRIPPSVHQGHLTEIMDAYKRRVKGVQWFGAVSVGGKPEFEFAKTLPRRRAAPKPEAPPRRRNSKLPPAWRIIEGGRT